MKGDICSCLQRMVDIASKSGIIEKSGAWYSYSGDRLGQGRENVKAFLAENDELKSAISAQVREALLVSAGGNGKK